MFSSLRIAASDPKGVQTELETFGFTNVSVKAGASVPNALRATGTLNGKVYSLAFMKTGTTYAITAVECPGVQPDALDQLMAKINKHLKS